MAGPWSLKRHGDSVVNIPTWQWPKTTKLCAKSLDPNNYATVEVHAVGASEIVGTTGGGTTCIDRSWAGFSIDVINARDDMDVPVEVWTE